MIRLNRPTQLQVDSIISIIAPIALILLSICFISIFGAGINNMRRAKSSGTSNLTDAQYKQQYDLYVGGIVISIIFFIDAIVLTYAITRDDKRFSNYASKLRKRFTVLDS